MFNLHLLHRFNTSHVTLYRSCLHQGNITNYSFNTSHVTLYPNPVPPLRSGREVSIHHMLLFIPNVAPTGSIAVQSFNTSHVTLYHQIQNWTSNTFSGFNTSHVTLYLYRTHSSPSACLVSIHHMLLFITVRPSTMIPVTSSFNTSHVTLYPSFYRDFIHPHV